MRNQKPFNCMHACKGHHWEQVSEELLQLERVVTYTINMELASNSTRLFEGCLLCGIQWPVWPSHKARLTSVPIWSMPRLTSIGMMTWKRTYMKCARIQHRHKVDLPHPCHAWTSQNENTLTPTSDRELAVCPFQHLVVWRRLQVSPPSSWVLWPAGTQAEAWTNSCYFS